MSSARVVIEEIDPDRREEVVNGQKVFRGRTLASLIREFGGYEGQVQRPSTGEMFDVSLEGWRDRNPESTWLDIMFVTDS